MQSFFSVVALTIPGQPPARCYNETMSLPDFPLILKEKCGLDVSHLILVGVSGGPDSLTLLDLMVKSGCKVTVAHFNHHLRPEAAADHDFVRAAAAGYGVNFHSGEGDVIELAKKEKLTIEEAARKARYQFLFRTADRTGARAVAVGHTADDQVETVLMHLLRGSGMAGLRGMPWKGLLPEFDGRIPLVRPLLGMWREEIMAYCEQHHLETVTDASNFDSTYYRNRLRLKLIPYLNQYNPRVKEVVWRMAQTFQGDYETVESAVNEAGKQVQTGFGQGFVHWKRHPFEELPAGIQRGLVRRMIADLRWNERDINFDTVERALEHIRRSGRSSEIELALGLNLQVEEDRIVIKEKDVDLVDPAWPRIGADQIDLPVPGKAVLLDGWELTAEVGEMEKGFTLAADALDRMTCWLDRDKLGALLQIRRHRAGDRMKPYGFEGHSIKISDIWVNLKLPREARKAWPLVISGGNIAWLPGYRPGQDFILDHSTRRAVRLELKKTGDA